MKGRGGANSDRGGGGRGRGGRGGRGHPNARRHNRHGRGGGGGKKGDHPSSSYGGGMPGGGHNGNHTGGGGRHPSGPGIEGGDRQVPPPPGWSHSGNDPPQGSADGSPFSFWCEVCEETLHKDVGGMAEHFNSPVHQLKLALKGKTMGTGGDEHKGAVSHDGGARVAGGSVVQQGPATTTESVLDALFGAAGQSQSARGGLPPGFSPQLPQKALPPGLQANPTLTDASPGPRQTSDQGHAPLPEYNPFGGTYAHPFGLGGPLAQQQQHQHQHQHQHQIHHQQHQHQQHPGHQNLPQSQSPANPLAPQLGGGVFGSFAFAQPTGGLPPSSTVLPQHQQHHQWQQAGPSTNGLPYQNDASQLSQLQNAMYGLDMDGSKRPPVHPSTDRSAGQRHHQDGGKKDDEGPTRRDSVKSEMSEKEPAAVKEEFCGPIKTIPLPLLPPPEYMTRITKEIMQQYEDLLPPTDEAKRRTSLVQHLQKVVSSKMPGSSIHTYGSSASGFSLKGGSDVDLCLEIDLDKHGTKRHIVNRLAGLMRKNRMRDVTAIGKARVPIVKFYDSMSRLSCDICVNNHLALRNSQMLRDYSLLDSRLKPLVLIVKYWAKRREINEPYRGSLSSYCYTLMCIFHLQTRNPPILPCLQRIPDAESKQRAQDIMSGKIRTDDELPSDMSTYCRKIMVDKWDVYSTKELDSLTNFGAANKETVGELLCSFLGFFAHEFDRDHAVASIREGRLLRKDEVGWNTTEERNRHLFCIQDPFDLSHDLGRVVDEDTIKELTDEFARGYRLLCQGASLQKVCESWQG